MSLLLLSCLAGNKEKAFRCGGLQVLITTIKNIVESGHEQRVDLAVSFVRVVDILLMDSGMLTFCSLTLVC